MIRWNFWSSDDSVTTARFAELEERIRNLEKATAELLRERRPDLLAEKKPAKRAPLRTTKKTK